MKRTCIQWLFVPLLCLLVMAGCKKNEQPAEPLSTNDPFQVKSWIASQGRNTNTAVVEQLAQLQTHLLLNQLQTDSLNDEEQIILVPVSKAWTPPNAGEAGAATWFVGIANWNNGLQKGLLVQLKNPGNWGMDVFKNLLYKAPNSGYSGHLTLLDLRGRFLESQQHENGRRKNSGRMKARSHARTSGCSEWYLIIHWEGPNGETWDTETFLGITCIGVEGNPGCIPAAPNVETSNCDGLGGIGGYDPEDDGVYAIKTLNWLVFTLPGTTGSQWSGVVSFEQFKGKRNSNEPQGGHFKWAQNSSTGCTVCNSDHPDDNWIPESTNVNLTTPQTAQSNIKGILNYRGNVFSVNNTKTFNFQDVF